MRRKDIKCDKNILSKRKRVSYNEDGCCFILLRLWVTKYTVALIICSDFIKSTMSWSPASNEEAFCIK